MKDLNDANFGIVIAFLLPGFLLLWTLSFSSVQLADWIAASSAAGGGTIGDFLFATLASLALGMIVSAVRWAAIDSLIHAIHYAGSPPQLDFSKMTKDNADAFRGIVENHYRYYQFYANTLVSLFIGLFVWVFHDLKAGVTENFWAWLMLSAIVAILFFASQDCLVKYYTRAAAILH
jgi:hypothetical protein